MPLSSLPFRSPPPEKEEHVALPGPDVEEPRESEVRQRCAAAIPEESPLERARRLHIEGEFDRALLLAGAVLEGEPGHHEATRIAAACRRALERECLVSIGGEDALLVPAVTLQESKRFPLDSTSAFLFSLVDGATRIEEIVDISGMPRLHALRQLRDLVDNGLVGAAPATPLARRR